jgi:two-component system sensor histidine kinase KdpD
MIGHLDTHKRNETINQIRNLKIIPPKKIVYGGKEYDEVDVEAIINIKPQTVIIDELAHANTPGSKNNKRYEDVDDILNNGINVITTLNIEHIEGLNADIRRITGVKPVDTVPDSIIENADQVVVVDLSTDELLKRLNNGQIYSENSTDHAIINFYKKNNLSALRELALRLTAEGVDEDLAIYMKSHGIHDNWHTAERVMVCISTNSSAKRLIRKAARIASKYK